MYKKTSDAIQHAQEVDAPGKTGGYKRGTLSVAQKDAIIPPTPPIIHGGLLENKDTHKTQKGQYIITAIIEPKDINFTKLFSKQVINLWNQQEQRHLISFRIPVPADYDLTPINLFDYLEYLVFNFGQGDPANQSHITLASTEPQWPHITFRRSVGVRHIILEQKDKRFSFIIEGESTVFAEPGGWKINTPSFIMYQDDENTYAIRYLKLSPEGLHLYHPRASYNYFIPYKTPLSPESLSQISLFGGERQLDPSYFQNPDIYKDSYKDTQLIWKSIGDFSYLEAVDRSVFICFTRQVSLHLIQAITQALEDRNDLKVEFLNRLHRTEISHHPKNTEMNYTKTALHFYHEIRHRLA